MSDILLLASLRRFSDLGLLALRIFVGMFLVWGVWDNVASAAHMNNFVRFLAKFDFPIPQVLAPLSVWTQLLVGVCFIVGLLTRWAGVICAINFLVAIIMVDRFSGIRGAFPSACLVMVGAYLALYGSGRFGIDTLLASQLHGRGE
jgi:putative oxidoreductase